MKTTKEFHEGQIAYWEDRPDSDNPYILDGERSLLKDEWNKAAQDWDDGWCDAHEQDMKIEEELS